MAGHSKWANIKHRKARQDAKAGKIFTKIIRELTVAARMGGGDPSSNPRLRATIDKAYTNNMKKDTVEKAIARGAGAQDGENYEEIRYEGYGPSGVAVMVDCLTDNKQRTVADVRHAFSKRGGNLGTDGSVAYMFKTQGVISFSGIKNIDLLMEAALEAGCEDVQDHGEGDVDVITTFETFMDVKDTLESQGYKAAHAEMIEHADVKTRIEDLETAQKVMALIDMLEENDDVQSVHTNVEFSDEIMEQLG